MDRTPAADGGGPTSAVIKTLVLTDLVGSTRLVEELGDLRASQVVAQHDRLARDILAELDGREIDKSDGFLLLFERPIDGVAYAQAYHRSLAQLSAELGVEIAARVGVHLGEVVLRENSAEDVARGAKPVEVEGLAKPTAARLMSLAQGRQTLLTRGAYDLARHAAIDRDLAGDDVVWMSHGLYAFQGVAEPVRVFEMGEQGFAPLAAPAGSEKARRVPEASGDRPQSDPTPVRDRGSGSEEDLGQPPSDLTGTTLAHYQITAKLGEGGMGEVYRAEDTRLGRDVALKLLPPELNSDPERRERFEREARTVAALNHSSIVTIFSVEEDGGRHFLTMELVQGETLAARIPGHGMPLAKLFALAIPIADALAAAHEGEVVHRDLKPENVMVDAKGRASAGHVKILDFGLANPERIVEPLLQVPVGEEVEPQHRGQIGE